MGTGYALAQGVETAARAWSLDGRLNDARSPSGQYLDILAISCDSFNEDVNVLIGRGQGKINHVENLRKLRRWCRDYKVAFKINSVINRFNVDEDMREHIKELNPVRWKVSTELPLLTTILEWPGEGRFREVGNVEEPGASEVTMSAGKLGPQSFFYPFTFKLLTLSLPQWSVLKTRADSLLEYSEVKSQRYTRCFEEGAHRKPPRYVLMKTRLDFFLQLLAYL